METFIINHDGGMLYQKDLGTDTARIAAEMTACNPDNIWKRVPDSED